MIEYFPPIDNAEDYIRRGDLLFKSTFRDGILDNSESTLQRLNHYYVSLRQVYEAPAADVVRVVRCKDCKYWKVSSSLGGRTLCTYHYNASYVRKQDDYCSKGELREDTE